MMNQWGLLKAYGITFLIMILSVLAIFVYGSTIIFAFSSSSTDARTEMATDPTGIWIPMGSLTEGRHEHTATVLSDGRVLVVGGLQERTSGSAALAPVEVYDQVNQIWGLTGSLNTGRILHTTTLLPDGRVLVTGGRSIYSGPSLASAEIYDPVSGIWNFTSPLSVPRCGHSATLLDNGRVLVAGGRFSTYNPDVHASAEIYDPVSDSWNPTGSLNTPRESHSATLLNNGQVLVINGYFQSYLDSAEVYDPVSGSWSEIDSPLSCHGVGHSATVLSDGKVLVVGGACGGPSGITADAEIYDPITSDWNATTGLPQVREIHTATLLPDGRVLIVGGDDGGTPRYASTLTYHPLDAEWRPTGSLNIGRRNHSTTLLDIGGILVIGGWGDSTTFLESAELFLGRFVYVPVIDRE
jgi:hypothetical protein